MSEQISQTLTAQRSRKFVGRPMKRREDAVLVTGHGTYVDDIKLPNMLFVSFVRSSYGHAKIRSIDLSPALKVPGVVFAIGGEEIKK